MTDLSWLPKSTAWGETLRARSGDGASWEQWIELAKVQLDFNQTRKLDAAVCRALETGLVRGPEPLRLAVLSSSSSEHLSASLRVAGLRRGLRIGIYMPPYGQYLQEMSDPDSALSRFAPQIALCAFDAEHLIGARTDLLSGGQTESVLATLRSLWTRLQDRFGCQVIQQTLLPTEPALAGSNEHRLPGAPRRLVAAINAGLREAAPASSPVDLLALDDWIAEDGLAAWHNRVLWHHAKQAVAPDAAPLFGDLAIRLIAARRGLSAKCLILDLDNTLWGGTIGDDGIGGIVLGQGSALGEAYSRFQTYVRQLSERGVVLAVCSKNDPETARRAFEAHPEMVLRGDDIACFIANWEDKATNIRMVAKQLNLGLDALVFVDDNPFERDLVRRELPMVAVPELSEDPVSFVPALTRAGYFEAVAFTKEDLDRARLYRTRTETQQSLADTTDMDGYLRGLEMELHWSYFDEAGLQRVVQLINKTNQFNLTTRRYSEPMIRDIMADPRSFGIQFRLVDRLGDNGVIAVVIGREEPGVGVILEAWLMSCRVFGRHVERATLQVVIEEARRRGFARLLGLYSPTPKNGIVSDLYPRLGFKAISGNDESLSQWSLDLGTAEGFIHPLSIKALQ